MEKKTIGSFIATLRKANGMTQRQLAEKLNVSDKAVSRWERDESAPDLTLIPVIAEIFGITSDELLRGERNFGTADSERIAAKTEKQLRHLLKDTQTRFHIRSAISVAIAVIGLIATMIGNAGFLRALIGFLCGCVFFTASLLTQVIFLIQGLSALDSEEFDHSLTVPVRTRLILGTEVVIGIIFGLFAFCLPLAIFVPDPHMGLQASTWIPIGLLFALAAVLLVLAASYLINIHLNITPKPDLKTPLATLRLRSARAALILLLILGVGHILLTGFLSENPQYFAGHRRFDTLESFKDYMETPTSYDGEPLTIRDVTSSGGNITYVYENPHGEVCEIPKKTALRKIYAHEDDTEPLLTYRRLNLTAAYIHYGSAFNDLLPIYVMTASQTRRANTVCELICIAYIATYAAALFGVGRHYRKKKKLL